MNQFAITNFSQLDQKLHEFISRGIAEMQLLTSVRAGNSSPVGSSSDVVLIPLLQCLALAGAEPGHQVRGRLSSAPSDVLACGRLNILKRCQGFNDFGPVPSVCC